MANTIAVANQKGGVGKTTTVVNVAAFAALAGKRVLVIDLDPQGNASSVLAPEYEGPCIFDGEPQAVADFPGLSVCPRGDDLEAWEHRLMADGTSGTQLRQRISEVASDADIALIDCPPSLATLPATAIQSADQVLVPIQCEYYAMEGLGQIMAYLASLDEQGLRQPELAGILLTMFDPRLALNHQVAQEIRRHFGDGVLNPPIPRDVALAAAPSHSRTIIDHDPLSPGGLAYLAVTKELLNGLE